MTRDAKQEAEEFLKELRNEMWDDKIHDSKKCAIIAQQRIIDLPIWSIYDTEELDYQREILKELEKL